MRPTFDQLRRDMAEAARLTFSVYRQRHRDEDFYAFALYTDDDAAGAIPAANTEQALQRAARRYEGGGGAAPSLFELRYVPDEWAYSGAEGSVAEWGRVWQMNDALRADDRIPPRACKQRTLEAMVLALEDLDAEGFFGEGPERERVTLMIWITASDEAERWRDNAIRRLNPRGVYERFWAELPPALRRGQLPP